MDENTSEPVTVCAILLNSKIEREVVVRLATSSGYGNWLIINY